MVPKTHSHVSHDAHVRNRTRCEHLPAFRFCVNQTCFYPITKRPKIFGAYAPNCRGLRLALVGANRLRPNWRAHIRCVRAYAVSHRTSPMISIFIAVKKQHGPLIFVLKCAPPTHDAPSTFTYKAQRQRANRFRHMFKCRTK